MTTVSTIMSVLVFSFNLLLPKPSIFTQWATRLMQSISRNACVSCVVPSSSRREATPIGFNLNSVFTNRYVKKWRQKVTSKSDIQKWHQKRRPKRDVQKQGPKVTPKGKSKGNIKNLVQKCSPQVQFNVSCMQDFYHWQNNCKVCLCLSVYFNRLIWPCLSKRWQYLSHIQLSNSCFITTSQYKSLSKNVLKFGHHVKPYHRPRQKPGFTWKV